MLAERSLARCCGVVVGAMVAASLLLAGCGGGSSADAEAAATATKTGAEPGSQPARGSGGGASTAPQATDERHATSAAVMEEQRTALKSLRAIVERLGSAEAAELPVIRKELGALADKLESLIGMGQTEMNWLIEELTKRRGTLLEQKGAESGADFWLLPGESVTVKERGKVFALRDRQRGSVGYQFRVTLAGEAKVLRVGDFVEFEAGGEICRVILKGSEARADGRYGFDLVCSPKPAADAPQTPKG